MYSFTSTLSLFTHIIMLKLLPLMPSTGAVTTEPVEGQPVL
jgi:hypothetical protein